MAFGRAVHGVLERARLGAALDGGDPAIARLAEGAADAAEVDVADVLAAAGAAVLSPSALAASRARRSWREVFVAAEVEGVVVEGFVDLLWEDAEGLHVADWKTDRIASSEHRLAKADRYALQLATYAVALEEATGRPVVELALVFCGSGEVAEHVVAGPALAEAKAAVRRRLAATGGPPRPSEDGGEATS